MLMLKSVWLYEFLDARSFKAYIFFEEILKHCESESEIAVAGNSDVFEL